MRLSSSEIHAISRDVADILLPELKTVIAESIENKDEVLSIQDVMKLFGKSKNAIYKKCAKGKLPYHKTEQGEYFFSSKEIYTFLLKG